MDSKQLHEMYDYTDLPIRRQLIHRFQAKHATKNLDIVIVTFNRLPYIQKCVWSIIAGASFPYRIHVFDDKSTDGTRKWLTEMKNRGLITTFLTTATKLGSAHALNYAINQTLSHCTNQWFVFANDDMWFHRWWDISAIDIVMKYDDCGAVSLYNYTALMVKKNSHIVDRRTYKVQTTGLGATLFYTPLWHKAGGFQLKTTQKMGFFATEFCHAFHRVQIPRGFMYQPIPHYVTHMDLGACKLNERDYEAATGYLAFRTKEKKK